MRFMQFFLPSLPGTMEERRRLRPIAHHSDRWQQMFHEVTEISKMAEDFGFEAVAFPEHHLHTEGMEMGSLPVLTQHVINNTNSIKVGPIGYVLPGWNPLRLALEIAWLDQITKGRTLVGFARGYQTRWLNQMAQKIHVGATSSDQGEIDIRNREAFEEVFEILKLAWKDEPFRFQGKHYEFPSPFEEGTPWQAAEWTKEYGSPGEIGPNNRIHKIDIVPKPFQKPHPPLFQAFSVSESTVRWCAKESIIPTLLISDPPQVRKLAEAYVEEGSKYGRSLEIGESIAAFRSLYPAESYEVSRKLADRGFVGSAFPNFFHHFGFTEAFRLPEDDEKFKGQKLPASESTIERFQKAHFAFIGTPDDIRREMDDLVENVNPEWFIWQSDQGHLPIDEIKEMLEMFGKQIMPHYR